MKRFTITCLALVFLSMAAVAQLGGATNKKANATERAQLKIDEYQTHLDLTPQQSATIFSLLENKNLKADSVRIHYTGYMKAMKTEVDQIPKEISIRSRRQQIKQIKSKYAPSLQPMKDSLKLFNEQCLETIVTHLSEEQVEKLEDIDKFNHRKVTRPAFVAPEPRQ